MLILSRKKNESLHVGDNITITVTQIGRDQVRLGIQAPRDVPIWRPEAKIQERETVRTVFDETPMPIGEF